MVRGRKVWFWGVGLWLKMKWVSIGKFGVEVCLEDGIELSLVLEFR